MNFEFSDEQEMLRSQARRFLAEHSSPRAVRAVLEGGPAYDGELWRGMAELGWLGAAIPEEYGGVGLGYLELCVIAEEIGRAVAPVPFDSSVCLASEAILIAGSEEQKRDLLPKLAGAERIACFALAEGSGPTTASRIEAKVTGGRLQGLKRPVIDANAADLAVVAAAGDAGDIGLYLVDLADSAVARTTLKSVDPARDLAAVEFSGAQAEPLAAAAGWPVIERVLDRAAVLLAFEQVGGAQMAMEMAKEYALGRFAFGRPIASFQAIKHRLADIYIKTELARSNAYFGAWALSRDAAELPVAAAAARVAATEAFHFAAKENIQIHGGMGFTWEFDCHLYYRRSKHLALALGSGRRWKDQLIDRLETRNAA